MWFRGSVFICICLWMVCGDPASFSAEIEAHFSESIPSESDLSKSTYLDPNSFRREGPEIQVLLCWNDFELLKVVSFEALQTFSLRKHVCRQASEGCGGGFVMCCGVNSAIPVY